MCDGFYIFHGTHKIKRRKDNKNNPKTCPIGLCSFSGPRLVQVGQLFGGKPGKMLRALSNRAETLPKKRVIFYKLRMTLN
jgi:hypothetical protein